MVNEFDSIVEKYISPVLCQYEKWIINEAERLGIDHLYFLARDGYQIYRIAEIDDTKAECSYFYCSRYALRMSAYQFFDDSAYEKLFIPSFRLTPESILERAGFSKAERLTVYSETGFEGNETDIMGRKKFSAFCNSVRESAFFNEKLKERSEEAYKSLTAYIRQENMHKCRKIGIVDLGWTGSMQHTLRRILDSMGIDAELHGFYIGMLNRPPVINNSSYHTWLFDQKDYSVKAWFAHNLMECICSAPHGMTTGYEEKDGKIVPVLAENENNSLLAEKTERITLGYAERSEVIYEPDFRKKALKLLRKLMFSPSISETCSLKEYQFCDDVGEQYHRSIIQSAGFSECIKEILPFKLFNTDSADGLYWYYGTLAASNNHFKLGLKYGYYHTKRLLSLVHSG